MASLRAHALVKQIKDELAKELPADDPDAKKKLAKYYEALREEIFRVQVTKDRIRPDHREFDQIRAISIETGVLPRTHGSALFTRGETQALVTATLGTNDDSQRLESFQGEQKKRFMLHYNFPPFSVGETGRMTGVGRREIGHGALAERAICRRAAELKTNRLTRSASSPTFWSRTALRRWPRSAAPAWR